MRLADRLAASFIKVAEMPVVSPDPEVSPMPRPPRNNPMGKIPIRKPAATRVSWQRDKASHPEFNKNVLSKKFGRSSSLSRGIESESPLEESDPEASAD